MKHQLDHMQIICILLQTDNHTGTSAFNPYGADAELNCGVMLQLIAGRRFGPISNRISLYEISLPTRQFLHSYCIMVLLAVLPSVL